MIIRLSRWSALTLMSAITLSACAGIGSTVPAAGGLGQSESAASQSRWEPQLSKDTNAQPNVTCPKRYFACVTVSKSKAIGLVWCYGPASDPCSKSDAGKVKWSGVVCLAKGPTCKGPIKQLTAKWSGPFKCTKNQKCRGTYELDTIRPGPGLKETSRYLYKQVVSICKGASCASRTLGFNVGP
jgi:hypothetical protein